VEAKQPERAKDWTERALAIDPEDPAVLYNVAGNYARLGMSEPALDCLEKAAAAGEWYKAWAEHDSDLDSLRSHPRFQALLKSL